ncbi:AAA family ATPase [Candidatus Woesearchaeota archaeon]|nr:AAA family ATPase [Candidatus Woesearchaeota archaeon]
MNRMYIGGVQGVGKDSLMGRVIGLKVINFAEMMRDMLKANLNHDVILKKLTNLEINKLRIKVLENLKGQDNIIVNGHYALPIRNYLSEIIDFEEGLPVEYYDLFSLYILINASPKNLIEHRRLDFSRYRDQSLSNIETELCMERLYFEKIKEMGYNGYIIINNNLESASYNLNNFIRKNLNRGVV